MRPTSHLLPNRLRPYLRPVDHGCVLFGLLVPLVTTVGPTLLPSTLHLPVPNQHPTYTRSPQILRRSYDRSRVPPTTPTSDSIPSPSPRPAPSPDLYCVYKRCPLESSSPGRPWTDGPGLLLVPSTQNTLNCRRSTLPLCPYFLTHVPPVNLLFCLLTPS